MLTGGLRRKTVERLSQLPTWVALVGIVLSVLLQSGAVVTAFLASLVAGHALSGSI